MKPAKVAAIAVGIVAAIALLVALVNGGGPRNIAGTYELYVGGKDSGTVVVVAERAGKYEVNMRGLGDLEENFIVPKARDNRYRLENVVNGKISARYELVADRKGLSGRATVLPVGNVDLFFKRVK